MSIEINVDGPDAYGGHVHPIHLLVREVPKPHFDQGKKI